MRALVFAPGPGLTACMAAQLGTFSADQAYAAGHNHKEIQRLEKARKNA